MKKYLLSSLMILGCCACAPNHIGLKASNEWTIHEALPSPIYQPKIETSVDWNL